MNKTDRLDLYTSIVPSKRQKAFCEMGFNAFIHFGINTYAQKEWSDGTLPASIFNPTELDTDQWAQVLKAAGAKGIILTCKHHDGFCLWQTETTEYSIKNSPYKNGKGDIVLELSRSCKKYGLKFGIYLSPWDRNSLLYATEAYNDFYISQLTELLTKYGEIFCVWLDGACGAEMDGKSKQEYDFNRIYETVYTLQPDCVISNCGPDVRWVGNEGGYARESEWNVVPGFEFDLQNIADNSQHNADEGEKMKARCIDVLASDLGSREVLSHYDSFIWYPAEVDVSIRPGWFYHKNQDFSIRSLNNLLNIYYTSVGGNSLLLLNVPPDKKGRIAQRDVKRLTQLGKAIKDGTEHKADVVAYKAPESGEETNFASVLQDDDGYYTPKQEAQTYEFVLTLAESTKIDKIMLKENCDFSQRIESFEIFTSLLGLEEKQVSGTTVGFKRYALFKKAVMADSVRIVITSCRKKPYIEKIEVLKACGPLPKKNITERTVKAVRTYFEKRYLINEEKKRNKAKQSNA